MNLKSNHTALFRKTSLVTLVAVYFLILVGGIVRSTGAGMGCPDWPKCFGQWIPPTSEAELSDGYKEDFVNYRKDKNQKLAGYLEAMGMDEKARQLRHDESIWEETAFNARKTWTEYINRLIGVIVGLLIVGNFMASIPNFKKDKPVVVLSLLLVVLVIFQGWIGSVVVSTNLLPWMVTVHMLLAMVILAILIYLVFRVRPLQLSLKELPQKQLLNVMLIITGLLVVVQIVFGTQVREAIDVVAASMDYSGRDSWTMLAGLPFLVHRSFSLVLLISQGIILYVLVKDDRSQGDLLRYAVLVLTLLVLEAITGMVMSYFGIPPFAQPLHLLLAMLIFGVQFLMILMLNRPSEENMMKHKMFA